MLGCKDQFPELQKEERREQENIDTTSSAEDEQSVCILYIEQMPEFPGGDEALKKFLQTHLRYPKTNACVSGAVYVSFLIKEDGTVTEVKIVRGIQEAYDAEAMRVVKMMPRWKPGVQSERPVAVRYTLPIRVGLVAEKIVSPED